MRTAAQSVFVAIFCVVALTFVCAPPAFAQTASSTYSITNSYTDTEPNIPQDHHTFTQVELIDILSAAMCQLTGIDPSDPQQPCLGVDPSTGKIGFAPTQTQQFGMATNSEPPVGGAVGLMTQYISSLYVPAVSTSQYVGYLADNFGISKPAYAAATDCNTSNFGYGFCGLNPLLKLWSDVRDLSYAFLTILFIAIGIGVMLRFKVDPRTVMTLQNQIPRVIIAIVLITFSFAIAGAMIDVMWTVTYAGINFIAQAAPNSQVQLCPAQAQPLNQVVETRLVDQPISFTNTVFRGPGNCSGTGIDSGLLGLSTKVSSAMGDLAQQLIHDLLLNNGGVCHTAWWNIVGDAKCAVQNGALNILLWITEELVKLIIVIAILIALFRLWFKLIQCYLTFLIFVILGPIWIVLGLIPGRPLGFEKWLRVIFANLAVFPLVAFILVFARVLTDIVPSGPTTPSTVFVPPLIGNPSIATFSDLMGFGAIMIAPTIPDIIKDRMKAKSQTNLGGIAAAGFGAGAAAFTSPGKRAWESLNRRNPQTGLPEGALAIQKSNLARKVPGLRKYVIAREKQRKEAAGYSSPEQGVTPLWRAIKNQGRGGEAAEGAAPAGAAQKPGPRNGGPGTPPTRGGLGGRGVPSAPAGFVPSPEDVRRRQEELYGDEGQQREQESGGSAAPAEAQVSKKGPISRFATTLGRSRLGSSRIVQHVIHGSNATVVNPPRPASPPKPKVQKPKKNKG